MGYLKTFFSLNLIETIRANLRTKSLLKPQIMLFGKTSLTMGKTATIICDNGRLDFNKSWYGRNYDGAYIHLEDNSTLKISDRCIIFRAADISVHSGAVLHIDNAAINNNANIHCSESIYIGKKSLIGEGVRIRDSDEHMIKRAGEEAGKISAPIIIGNNVLVAMNVTILKGVTIGDGSVIAAGSVVTKDVPPRSLAAGVPARVIAENIEWGPRPGYIPLKSKTE